MSTDLQSNPLMPSGGVPHGHRWGITSSVAIVVTLMVQGFGYLLATSGHALAAIPHADPAWVTAIGGIIAAMIYVIGGRWNSKEVAENKRLRKLVKSLRLQAKEHSGESGSVDTPVPH